MKKIIYTIVLIFGLGFGMVSSAEKLNISFPVEKFVLQNGLTVLLAPDPKVPLVSYQTWYKVGSRNESPGVTGAAHMLEHMMFKGSKNYSEKKLSQFFTQNGISYNAFTSWDYTGFYQTLPSHLLSEMMKIEVDRMSQLQLKAEGLVPELQVVAEERRMRVDNNPQSAAREAFFDLLFTQANYRWPIIGWMKDIQQYTVDKLDFFHKNFYLPNNAILVLAGDFDPVSVKSEIEKVYGNLKSGQVLQTSDIPEPEPFKSLEIQVRKNIQSPSLMMGYKTVPTTNEESYALDILDEILGGGSSSRLYKELVLKKQLALGVSGFQMGLKKEGVFAVFVTLKAPGENTSEIEKAKQIVLQEMKKLQDQKVSAKDLQKAKNTYLKSYVDSFLTFEGRANLLASTEILYGDYQMIYKQIEKYNAVTAQQVQNVAKKYFNPQRLRTVYLLPESKPVADNKRSK